MLLKHINQPSLWRTLNFMSVKINYSKNTSTKPSGNNVFYVNDKFSISQLTKYISKSEINYIGNLLRNEDLKKKIHALEISIEQ